MCGWCPNESGRGCVGGAQMKVGGSVGGAQMKVGGDVGVVHK